MTEKLPDPPACLGAIPIDKALRITLYACMAVRNDNVDRLRSHIVRELGECMCSADYVEAMHYLCGSESPT